MGNSTLNYTPQPRGERVYQISGNLGLSGCCTAAYNLCASAFCGAAYNPEASACQTPPVEIKGNPPPVENDPSVGI